MPQGRPYTEAVVIVATVRAMKMNGGVAKDDLGTENVDAVKDGCANLGRHIENIKKFGVPAVVGINHFITDTDAEVQAVSDFVKSAGCRSYPVQALGARVRKAPRSWPTRSSKSSKAALPHIKPLYADDMSLFDKIEAVAKNIYRADDVVADAKIMDQLKAWEDAGLRQFAGLHGKDPVFLHH